MQVIESFQGFRFAPHKRTLFGVSIICSLGATWLLTKVVPQAALYLTLEPCSPSAAAFVLAKVAHSFCHAMFVDGTACLLQNFGAHSRSQHGSQCMTGQACTTHLLDDNVRPTLIQSHLLTSVMMCQACAWHLMSTSSATLCISLYENAPPTCHLVPHA